MMTTLDITFGAATLRGEAESQGDLGMEWVAWVIRRRLERTPWPGTVVGVVLDDLDFSFWNGDSKRRSGLLVDRTEAHWNAVRIFTQVMFADEDDDPTDGADHYFNPDLANPSWKRAMKHTGTYKDHSFYNSKENP